MTDERPKGQEPEAEEERLKRPDDEVKDLEPPREESDEVKAGRKAGGKQLDYP